METILNLLWLVITLAALWLWRFRWAASRPHPGYSTRIEATAMVCVLALLFPVISLTDDLHPETVAVDAASGKRNACLLAASMPHARAATLSQAKQFVAGAVSKPSESINLITTRSVFVDALPYSGVSAVSSGGRSPPALL